MTAQTWSTRSSVPWEQEDVKSSGSHDTSPDLQEPQTVLGLDMGQLPQAG